MTHHRIWALALALIACDSNSEPGSPQPNLPDTVEPPSLNCELEPDERDGAAPDFLRVLGCPDDFEALASAPLDATIPGVRSLKVVYDRIDSSLYFQHVGRYATHYAFVSEYLSGQGKPLVPPLNQFNQTEYYSPSRRFVLGTLSYYEGPKLWAFELAPYDNASVALIAEAFYAVRDALHFEADLRYHPSSANQEQRLQELPSDISIVSTRELFANTPYQPLNLGRSTGRLRFARVNELASQALDIRDLVVLDQIPNDLSVVAGIITATPQTPLSHLNVLSQNRGTPNMSLQGAFQDETLRALEGRFVELSVEAFGWSIREITQSEADAWWEANRPTPLGIPGQDLTQRELVSMSELLQRDEDSTEALAEALKRGIRAYGGKASHYAALFELAEAQTLRVHPAFAIPIAYYDEHLRTHGLDVRLRAMLTDPAFRGDPALRAQRLAEFRHAIVEAPLAPALLEAVEAKLLTLPSQRARFRSSTNAEDLEGFTGAGLYTSETGDLYDSSKPIERAIKTVWASTWLSRAYDEREYRGITHEAVGMAILVAPSFPTEEANGVAITRNLFDLSGREPGFVINVQRGDTSIVKPPLGVTSDYFVYYPSYPGQPSVYLSHSNLIAPGQTVLSTAQTYELGLALKVVHDHFAALYRHEGHPYAMDVEFKFDGPPGGESLLWLKQARPYDNAPP